MGPLGNWKEYFIKSEKTQFDKKLFQLQTTHYVDISSWTRLLLCEKNLKGALHVKQTNNWCLKLIEPRSLKFTQNFRNYETFPIYVEIADEIEANTLFDRSLPSTRCFLDISPERAPLKPVSQRIWTPLRRFGSPYQAFLLSIDFIIFDN